MVTIIILLSHGIYIDNNWRPGGTVLGIRYGLGWAIRARLWLHLSRLYRLRTVRCIRPWSSYRLIIPSIYLLMGAGRLVTLLSWVLVLSGPTVRGRK
jgi:hypothetical protein